MTQSPRLAYIVGASHSGSTLLAMLLGAHPEICTIGELAATNFGNADRYRCSCRSLIQDCEFWRKVSRAMAVRGIPGFQITRAGTSFHDINNPYARRLLAPLHRRPGWEFLRDVALSCSGAWRTQLANALWRNLALLQCLRELTGARWIVDSSKLALRLKYLRRLPGIEVKVIWMIRDGRAVALTYQDEATFADASDPALRGGGSGQRCAPAQDNMANAAHEWRRSNESARCVVARLPSSHWTQVRYEELCRSPRATLVQLCAFLGVDPAGIRLDFRTVPQHVIGNGMRLDSTSEIKLDDRWQTHLSAEDIRTFDQVAGCLNRHHGYQ